MKHVRFFSLLPLTLSFNVLFLPIQATVQQDSSNEEYAAIHDESYVYLKNRSHNISNFVFAISQFDSNTESPIHALKNHLSNGFVVALQNDILNVLGYADWLLEQNIFIDSSMRNKLVAMVDSLVEAVLEGDLAIESDLLIEKSSLPLWIIDKRIEVKGKAKFDSEAIFYKDVRFHDPVRFYAKAHFKKGIKVDGTASINDAVI